MGPGSVVDKFVGSVGVVVGFGFGASAEDSGIVLAFVEAGMAVVVVVVGWKVVVG